MRKVGSPRITIKASEAKKEPKLGEVHKLLQGHSMVRNRQMMDLIVEHKRKAKNIKTQSKVNENYVDEKALLKQQLNQLAVLEASDKQTGEMELAVFQPAPLAAEASLAAESLAMDQKYTGKDKRSRALDHSLLSPRLDD
jgi:hypothetical protein